MKHLNVARATFYKLIREGRITRYQLPGMQDPRFDQDELDRLFTPMPADAPGTKPQEP